ncbi:beta-lactamase/transpeptidase-like protein [Annulohypoxylon bovei var. microspora]|nr:beta-lactamase/transpeptidase-like protein [Annulohypoxylon bovei var. microspora]
MNVKKPQIADSTMDPSTGKRLRDRMGIVGEIRDKCGVGSISIGVIHQGKVIFTDSTGHRDVLKGLAPDINTLYTLCSISKSFIATAVGILVHRGKCKWTDTVGQYLPEFNPKGDVRVATKATFNDFLRHSGGLANPVVTLLGPEGKVLVSQEDFINVLNDTPTGNERFGSYYNRTWEYSNVSHGLVALVIERLSGRRYADFISEEILKPLGMNDTVVYKSRLSSDANIAHSYVRLSDGTWYKQPDHEWTDELNTPVLAMVGIRSSIKDLLTWCAATLDAQWGEDSKPLPALGTTMNPLREVNSILNKSYWTRPVKDDLQNLSNYYLSWYKCVLPSSMVHWGSWNTTLADNGNESQKHINTHILGRESSQRPLYKVTGIGFCGTGSVHLFPETMSAVVVLGSGLNLGDPSDFTAAVMIQALFDLKERIDIMPMVLYECKVRQRDFMSLVDDWNKHRDVSVVEYPAKEYVGQYTGLGITLTVREKTHSGGLQLIFNGKEDIMQNLEHYNEDMYSYQPTNRDNWLRGGWLDWDYYMVGILQFQRDMNGQVSGATWVWERGCDAALFNKRHT